MPEVSGTGPEARYKHLRKTMHIYGGNTRLHLYTNDIYKLVFTLSWLITRLPGKFTLPSLLPPRVPIMINYII